MFSVEDYGMRDEGSRFGVEGSGLGVRGLGLVACFTAPYRRMRVLNEQVHTEFDTVVKTNLFLCLGINP